MSLTRTSDSHTNRPRIQPVVWIALMAVGASAVILWTTAQGPGVSPDSTTYIHAAKSVLAGDGFVVSGEPMTHFPPVYPLLLSLAATFASGDVLYGARLLHALLFGLNVCLIGAATSRAVDYSLSAPLCAILLFASPAATVLVHSMAWSESAFVMFSILGLLLLAEHIAKPRFPLLVLAAVAFGLAITTRYAGVALLPMIVVGLLVFDNRLLRYRLNGACIAVSIASAPLIVWLCRNAAAAESLTNRSLGFHPVGLSFVTKVIGTMQDYMLPAFVPGWVKIVALVTAIVVIGVGLAILKRNRKDNSITASGATIVPSLCLVATLAYILFLFVSVSFIDAQTRLDTRIIFPAFAFLTIATTSLCWSIAHNSGKNAVWLTFVVVVVAVATTNSAFTGTAALDMHINGWGYTSHEWKDSETIAAVKSLDRRTKIYSNGADVVDFLTGSKVVFLPRKTIPSSRQENVKYRSEMQAMCREAAEGKAVVVNLNSIVRWYLPTDEEVASYCNLAVSQTLKDGRVYVAARRATLGAQQH
jgi:Dolichyl-phosphate-mannose-protein mannosyltransferase